MSPLLAPGLHVLRRQDGRLQIGLDPARAVRVPDTPEHRRRLAELARGTLTADSQGPAPVRPLLRRPDEATAMRVGIVGFGHASGLTMLDRVRELLTTYGLGAPGRSSDLVLVAGVGEPRRDLVDDLVRRGTPHLLLRLVEGQAVVGPFVAPGRTACLRCLDACATDEDSSWPVLVDQYARLSASDRPDGITEPVDPALADLAAGWAVRDLVSFSRGHRPSTWSRTLQLDPLLHEVQITEWLRHPTCGCSWTMAE
jgi:bacteriocin biosynthesis cyclodehydratase domain-containing protein